MESVPPKLYGGTERVVAFLTDELVRLGHDVTVFATADSRTAGRLVASWPMALRLDRGCRNMVAPHILMLEQVVARAPGFDVIHFHTSDLHLPVARRLGTPHVTTLHGRLDMPELVPLYREFDDVPLVSISEAQRAPLPDAAWAATILHGLPPDLLPYRAGPGEYLAFVGRIAPEKRVDRAIAIATACNQPLRIAAKIDDADREYFEREIRHLFDHPLVDYVGEIDERQIAEFFGRAKALLFPIDWPEPFGLVMIEALSCGTPVVAYRGGSVPEIVEDGVTGFIVDSLEDAIAATRNVGRLDRRRCREAFERRFTVTRMAEDYLSLYEQIVECRRSGDRLPGVA
jgi:glycosyltransferase involved in cell wall biosynthesis